MSYTAACWSKFSKSVLPAVILLMLIKIIFISNVMEILEIKIELYCDVVCRI
jgi:hypothetical protein